MTVEEWLGADNKLGQDIWHKKYQRNNETFDDWVTRVSNGDEEIEELIRQKKFLAGGRVLSNIGIDNDGSLFNCYSYGYVDDDYKSILQAAMDIGLTFKAQGGQGLSLSKLRPKNAPIGKEYTSDGIIPFMKIFNEVTAGTSQGGSRKGALMMSLDAWHKEALDFIKIKSQEGAIEKANLSLEIDDEFMKVIEDYYANGEEKEIEITKDYSGHKVTYTVKPIEVFKALVDNCYDWGDPACLFTNRFRNYNMMEFCDDYQIENCNPCGEQPLPKHGACCLASINLSEFVMSPYTPFARIDYISLTQAVASGIDYLDSLIDVNYYRHPLEEQREMSYNYRNVGLGAFGYATMLMKLGLTYGSEEAIELTDKLFNLIFRAAVDESYRLAEKYGAFPKYNEKLFDSQIIKNHFTQDEINVMKKVGLRNCSLISIAPNGSLASLLNESGGCEPEYAISYTRRTVGMTNNEDSYYTVNCKGLKEYLLKHPEATNNIPDYFIGSADIPWIDRVRTQAVMQNHVDTAISSTVNLPQSATKEDIANIYRSAWAYGLKGITIFRDGCKKVGILTTGNSQEAKNDTQLNRGDWKPLAEDTVYYKKKLRIGCGSLKLFIGWSESEQAIQDIYIKKAGSGGCERLEEAVAITMSAILRLGGNVCNIKKAFSGLGACNSFTSARKDGKKLSRGSSCAMVILNAMEDFVTEHKKDFIASKGYEEHKPNNEPKAIKDDAHCPECGKEVVHIGGCIQCSCGWSKCE